MGSPQYGELILDGEPIAKSIEHESLTWSDDRRLLGGQQLVSCGTGQGHAFSSSTRTGGWSSPLRRLPTASATRFGSRRKCWCTGAGITSGENRSCGFGCLSRRSSGSSDRRKQPPPMSAGRTAAERPAALPAPRGVRSCNATSLPPKNGAGERRGGVGSDPNLGFSLPGCLSYWIPGVLQCKT
jgi:hypothetical protein